MNENKIEILSDFVINKLILSSITKKVSYIIKELLENSCDAKSNNISVYIENNGSELIKIIDDGDGIYKDDLQKCGLRYATSKIKMSSDINKINTYGFYGESLYLIKNLSHMILISKPKDQEYAYKITFLDEFDYKIEKCAGRNGTEIIIKNLKNNDIIESYDSIFIPQKIIALANFDKHFKFYKESKEFKNLPPCYDTYSIAKRIEDLIGEKYLENSININYENSWMNLNGFISENKYKTNNNDNYNYLFINKRYIHDTYIKNFIKKEINEKSNKALNYCLYLNLTPNEFKIKKLYDKTTISLNRIEYILNTLKSVLTKYKIKKKIYTNIKIKENILKKNSSKTFLIINKNISNDMIFKSKNKILTILENKFIFFEINRKVYITNIMNLRRKIILEECIKQMTKFGKLNSRNLQEITFINLENKEKIKIYKNILIKYGFFLENFFNEKILIQSIPEIIFNLPINLEKLITDLIKFLDKNIPIFFSINRFDINVVNIFTTNVETDHQCYEFEIEIFYKELINSYNTIDTWFKKNCFEVSCKKALNSFKI